MNFVKSVGLSQFDFKFANHSSLVCGREFCSAISSLQISVESGSFGVVSHHVAITNLFTNYNVTSYD